MKRILIGCVVVLLLALLVIGLQVLNRSAKRPFENLKVSQVKEIYLLEGDIIVYLDEEQQKDVLRMLSEIDIYEIIEDPMLEGGSADCSMHIVKKSGREFWVLPGSTHIIINGIFFRIDYNDDLMYYVTEIVEREIRDRKN